MQEIFLVLHMLSNFEFYHANFKYYECLGLVEIHGEC